MIKLLIEDSIQELNTGANVDKALAHLNIADQELTTPPKVSTRPIPSAQPSTQIDRDALKARNSAVSAPNTSNETDQCIPNPAIGVTCPESGDQTAASQQPTPPSSESTNETISNQDQKTNNPVNPLSKVPVIGKLLGNK